MIVLEEDNYFLGHQIIGMSHKCKVHVEQPMRRITIWQNTD